MKCPWRVCVHVYKSDDWNTRKNIEWGECYKEACPFYDKDLRRKKPDICLRPYREDWS